MDVFGDTKEVIKNRKSKKDRQYNNQNKMDNDNDLQSTANKTED